MSEKIQVYWSFRSPYSYLITPDLLRIKDEYAVDIELCVVLPIAVRSKELVFDTGNKNKVSYILLDMVRRAEFLGIPITRPNPDPVVQDLDTFQVADDQPYIFHLCSLGVEANRLGKGIEFAAQVSKLIWGGTPNWDEGDHLAQATSAAGLDLASMEAAIQSSDHMAEVEKNQESLEQAGHWGVPTVVVRGEPFFGQDRVSTLEWRLDQLGLRRNSEDSQ